MEEEKKNNKGLMVGIIIFLIICLVAIFYFMFKMTYVGEKKSQSNENNNTETTETTQGEITELTTITLKEGEEVKKTIGGKEFTFKGENQKYYINNQEVEAKSINFTKYTVYFTNNLIIFPYNVGQSGNKFIVYNLNQEIVNINDKGGQDAQYLEIRYKKGRLLVDIGKFGDGPCTSESQCFFEKLDALCENEKYKDVNEYTEELEKYKNDKIYTTTYEIKYDGKEVIIEPAEDIKTIESWINTFDKVCVIE